jgi:hypothetical protein
MITEIQNNEPHINFYGKAAVHVVPLSVIKNIADGKTDLESLDDYEEIVKIVFADLCQRFDKATTYGPDKA